MTVNGRMTAALGLALCAALAACGGGENGPAREPAASPDTAGAPAGAPDRLGSPGPDAAAICDTIRNSFRCARAVEERRLPDAERASRSGDTLRLALTRGDTVRLVDPAGEADEVVHYSYQDHWRRTPAGVGYFLVQQQFYEGSQFLLVNDSTGDRTILADRPLPAPGGARFAVLSLDLVAGYGPNVLQVWSLGKDGPTREWETEPEQWGPRDGTWTDSVTLRFTQHGYCDQLGGSGRRMCDRFATVRRAGGSWNFEVGRPDDG